MHKFLIYLISLVAFALCLISCESPTVEDTHIILPTQYEWETASLAELYLDSTLISQAVETAGFRRYINSMLIIRDGKIASENYFNGYIGYSANNIASASKSVLSILIGIAVDQNIIGLDDKMMDFFPEYNQPTIEPEKYDISVEHLLTMKGGIQSETQASDVLIHYDDLMAGIIYIPLYSQPGEIFNYSSLGTHLLSGILTQASGISSLEFANANLFEPMQISIEGWSQDGRDYYTGGSGMLFTARNLAAFGQLFLNKGTLNGQRIVSEDWINRSSINYSLSAGESWEAIDNLGYVYLWWLGSVDNHDVYFALGYGGQFLFCVPEYDLIIVITSDGMVPPEQSEKQEREVLEIITEIILPAVMDQ